MCLLRGNIKKISKKNFCHVHFLATSSVNRDMINILGEVLKEAMLQGFLLVVEGHYKKIQPNGR